MHKIAVTLIALLVGTPAGSPALELPGVSVRQVTEAPLAGPLREAIARLPVASAAGPRGDFVQQPQARRRSWPSRHPVLFGTVVGAGVGAVAKGKLLGLPYDTCIYDSEMTGCDAASSAIGAGIGATFGAVIGFVVSIARR